ncbi:MAG: WhiB family transcriptional regulator [Actinomycetota bacterium]|jgi:WhiB family transcriptional regulator, redox-sensing transcriptional regulator
MAPAWMWAAACRGMPPARFYPPPGVSADDALAVCARCPVRDECDRHATETAEEHGIWGGRLEIERTRQRADRSMAGDVRRSGPAPAISDSELVALLRSLDPDIPAAAQLLARLHVSVPTAYKYLHRASRLGAIERRGRHLYPRPDRDDSRAGV